MAPNKSIVQSQDLCYDSTVSWFKKQPFSNLVPPTIDLSTWSLRDGSKKLQYTCHVGPRYSKFGIALATVSDG